MTLFFCGAGCPFVQAFVYSTNYPAKCKQFGGFLGDWAVKNLPTMQEMRQEPQVWSLDQEDPLEKEMATPIFLPGESHGQRRRRSLEDYSP